MGADGPGKAGAQSPSWPGRTSSATTRSRRATTGSSRTRWTAGALTRDDVTDLGAVLAGTAEGRGAADEITALDSTGLAIQDLAVALAALERADELELPSIDL